MVANHFNERFKSLTLKMFYQVKNEQDDAWVRAWSLHLMTRSHSRANMRRTGQGLYNLEPQRRTLLLRTFLPKKREKLLLNSFVIFSNCRYEERKEKKAFHSAIHVTTLRSPPRAPPPAHRRSQAAGGRQQVPAATSGPAKARRA